MARISSAQQFVARVRRMAYRTTLGPSRPDDRHQRMLPMPGDRRRP